MKKNNTVFFQDWIADTLFINIESEDDLWMHWTQSREQYQGQIFNDSDIFLKNRKYQKEADVFYEGLDADIKSNSVVNYLKHKYPKIEEPNDKTLSSFLDISLDKIKSFSHEEKETKKTFVWKGLLFNAWDGN